VTTVLSGEKGGEGHDHALDQLREITKRWEDRFTFKNMRLIERYLNAETWVVIHLANLVGSHAVQLLAIVQRAPNRRADREGHSQVVRQVGSYTTQSYEGVEGQGGETTKARYERPVFVDPVKLMNLPEPFIPSLIWFGRIDEINSLLTGTHCFTGRLGVIRVDTLKDWELRGPGNRAIVGLDEFDHEMVEGGTQIVDGIPDQRRPVHGDLLVDLEPEAVVAALWVYLSHDSISVGVQKPLDTRLKVLDVMYGPINFQPDSGWDAHEP
jgi:hypothetical protein